MGSFHSSELKASPVLADREGLRLVSDRSGCFEGDDVVDLTSKPLGK